MKLKLDENLGLRGQSILRAEDHDVSTVFQQQLQSASDEVLADVCAKEQRILLTLDLDFANPLRFPPVNTPGIAVLRVTGKPSNDLLLHLVQTFAIALRTMDITGKLWVVEPGRIRIHQND